MAKNKTSKRRGGVQIKEKYVYLGKNNFNWANSTQNTFRIDAQLERAKNALNLIMISLKEYKKKASLLEKEHGVIMRMINNLPKIDDNIGSYSYEVRIVEDFKNNPISPEAINELIKYTGLMTDEY